MLAQLTACIFHLNVDGEHLDYFAPPVYSLTLYLFFIQIVHKVALHYVFQGTKYAILSLGL